ncbi:MAG: hypothetical protein J6S14_22050 [Clostridia bacterium]|nr:hypothetical protein [Clostridia bacterium]
MLNDALILALSGSGGGGGGGSDLPSVTSADNGDVLQVKSGAWAKSSYIVDKIVVDSDFEIEGEEFALHNVEGLSNYVINVGLDISLDGETTQYELTHVESDSQEWLYSEGSIDISLYLEDEEVPGEYIIEIYGVFGEGDAGKTIHITLKAGEDVEEYLKAAVEKTFYTIKTTAIALPQYVGGA